MKYAIYAAVGLLWISGTAGAQPTTLILDSIVLPESAVEVSKVVPVPLGNRVRTHYEVLPELDLEKALARDEVPGKALQIGVPRAVVATSSVAQVQSVLKWSPLPSGQQVAAINIQSTGAYGLRAGVLVDSLPDDALLRIYSQERPDAIIERKGAEVNALLAQNRNAGETGAAANTWWTPDVGAGDSTVEVVLPAGIGPDALRISIPMVSHIYHNLSLPTDEELAYISQEKASGSCNLDVSCTTDYEIERNAVARMRFTRENGRSYLCTGALLNNTKADFAPYFLTADHCISTQSAASTLQTDWFYRSSRCNSGVPGASHTKRSAGATLLFATSATDSSLLKLNEMPPAGVTLAGWDALTPGQKDDAVFGLHHPSADLIKYSIGAIADHVEPNRNFYEVRWSEGTTEGGSSGSPLLRNGRVVGTLTGGSASCSTPDGNDSYGRFDKVFTDHLWNWLAN